MFSVSCRTKQFPHQCMPDEFTDFAPQVNKSFRIPKRNRTYVICHVSGGCELSHINKVRFKAHGVVCNLLFRIQRQRLVTSSSIAYLRPISKWMRGHTQKCDNSRRLSSFTAAFGKTSYFGIAHKISWRCRVTQSSFKFLSSSATWKVNNPRWNSKVDTI